MVRRLVDLIKKRHSSFKFFPAISAAGALFLFTACVPKLIVPLDRVVSVSNQQLSVISLSPTSPSSIAQVTLVGGSTASIVSVSLYSDAACSIPLGSGSFTQWTTAGITVAATTNSTTTIYGIGTNSSGSPLTNCSLLSSYAHDNIPPTGSIAINTGGAYTLSAGYTNSAVVSLSLSATDSGVGASGLSQMYITNTLGCGSGGQDDEDLRGAAAAGDVPRDASPLERGSTPHCKRQQQMRCRLTKGRRTP